jgi:hypothetical protein
MHTSDHVLITAVGLSLSPVIAYSGCSDDVSLEGPFRVRFLVRVRASTSQSSTTAVARSSYGAQVRLASNACAGIIEVAAPLVQSSGGTPVVCLGFEYIGAGQCALARTRSASRLCVAFNVPRHLLMGKTTDTRRSLCPLRR